MIYGVMIRRMVEHGDIIATRSEFNLSELKGGRLQPREQLYTIERPWRGNIPFQSCIPSGHYAMVPYSSAKYPDSWAFIGNGVGILPEDWGGSPLREMDRFNCLLHSANYVRQVVGCAGPGEAVWDNDDEGPSVGSSRNAMARIAAVVGAEAWQMRIGWD